jgi:bifunctional non-homologous end joining protein LigD
MPKAPGVARPRPIEASDLMLATVRKRPFSDPDWLYEWKYDGFRCLVRKTSSRVELLSRNGNSLNTSFPDFVEAVSLAPGDFVWDGELNRKRDLRGLPLIDRKRYLRDAFQDSGTLVFASAIIGAGAQ